MSIKDNMRLLRSLERQRGDGRNSRLLLSIFLLQTSLKHLIVIGKAVLVLGSNNFLGLSSLLSTATFLGLEHQKVSIV
jgi:hypothetical protein